MTTSEPAWFKSSYSGTGGDNCVEVAVGVEAVLVRDSKNVGLRRLEFDTLAWSAFVATAASARSWAPLS
ncbi:DUF397 domain-containing protein [Streptomyces sp. NPDC051784]|uniref:DUF397 domain-containing protein n=1 Tax=Streptomyces sp. NPDC051784 TaxID=3155805 RepID=UPI0034371D0B